MRTTVVVGNPKADSRTLHVAVALADALADRLPGDTDRLVVDLADVVNELFDPTSETVNRLLNDVAHSELIIVASPTYKATYTGLLKSFFDRYGNDGLRGAIAVPVMTGAAPIHALAPEVHLRALLVELGACVPTRSLYVTEHQFDTLDLVIDSWVDAAGPCLVRVLAD
jgi:FMN reductase